MIIPQKGHLSTGNKEAEGGGFCKSLKKTLTNVYSRDILNKCLGAWCNGNTWVSKTFVVGSNPTAPARNADSKESAFFCCLNKA